MAANTNTMGAPGVTNDASQGFGAGSIWRDMATGRTYVCTDATVGAAVWKQTSVDAASRPQPVDPDAAIVRGPAEVGLLQTIAAELKAIRLILGEALQIEIDPDDLD